MSDKADHYNLFHNEIIVVDDDGRILERHVLKKDEEPSEVMLGCLIWQLLKRRNVGNVENGCETVARRLLDAFEIKKKKE